jgi:hypothetical protein
MNGCAMTANQEELRARIRGYEAKLPMPKAEADRMRQRRWVLTHVRKGGIGAEIGVFRGWFSELICEIARPSKLYLIDPWTTIGRTFGWGKDYTGYDTLTTADAKAETECRVALYPEVEAVLVEDIYPRCQDRIVEPLDFAYLDAGHQYERTLWELRALAGQVATGGLILGDDWHPDPRRKHHGVFRAVQEFTRAEGWEIVAAGHGAQWVIRRQT